MKLNEDFSTKGIVNINSMLLAVTKKAIQLGVYDSSKKKAVCAVELNDDWKVKRFILLKFQIIQLNHCEKCSTNTLIKTKK
jgi:hypothetical protein